MNFSPSLEESELEASSTTSVSSTSLWRVVERARMRSRQRLLWTKRDRGSEKTSMVYRINICLRIHDHNSRHPGHDAASETEYHRGTISMAEYHWLSPNILWTVNGSCAGQYSHQYRLRFSRNAVELRFTKGASIIRKKYAVPAISFSAV